MQELYSALVLFNYWVHYPIHYDYKQVGHFVCYHAL